MSANYGATSAQSYLEDDGLDCTVRRNALERGAQPAFGDDCGGTLTWREYYQRAEIVSSDLSALGVGRRDRLLVVMPDGPDIHVVYLAAQMAGAVVVGISPRSAPRQIAETFSSTGATGVLTGRTVRGVNAFEVLEAVGNAGVTVPFHAQIEDGTLTAIRDTGSIADRPDRSILDAVGQEGAVRLAEEELFFLNTTSGTTGLPKTVAYSQRRYKFFTQQCLDFTGEDRFLVIVPTCYQFGLWMSHFTPTHLGAPTWQAGEFDPSKVLAMIERHEITVLCGVTTQMARLAQCPEMDRFDLSSLRIVQCGGERFDRRAAEIFESRTGAALLQFYGSSEVGLVSGTRLADSTGRRFDTVGRILDGVEVRLVGDDGILRPGPGEGQGAVRSPMLSLGYLDDAAATRALAPDDGWMLTGDRIRVDDDSSVRIVGREADFIIRAGYNVSSVAVELIVGEFPDIVQIAVVGCPDVTVGERVCAFVVSRSGAEVELADVLDFLRERGHSKVNWPEVLVTLPGLPEAPGGKIAKSELRALAAARVEVSNYPPSDACRGASHGGL